MSPSEEQSICAEASPLLLALVHASGGSIQALLEALRRPALSEVPWCLAFGMQSRNIKSEFKWCSQLVGLDQKAPDFAARLADQYRQLPEMVRETTGGRSLLLRV